MNEKNPNKTFKGRGYVPKFGHPSKQSTELVEDKEELYFKYVNIELTQKERERIIKQIRELNREYAKITESKGLDEAKEVLFKNGSY